MPTHTMVRNTTITVALVSAVTIAAAAIALGLVRQNTVTYVRIVDAEFTSDDTASPGADLRSVSISRQSRDRTWYANAVVSGSIKNGADNNNNEYKNPDAMLGDPADKTEPEHLSLGGGEVVIRLPIIAKAGDTIFIDEIGSKTGSHPDSYEVTWSRKPSGPWEPLGTSDGPSTFTITE